MKIVNFAEKLEKVLKEHGLKQVQLARLIGQTPKNISRLKKEDDIPEKFIAKLCSALKLPDDYFSNNRNASGTKPDDYFQVPFREAEGGMGGGCHVGSRKIFSHISLSKSFLLQKTNNLDKLSFIHASGDSMYPTIVPDAAVLIDESQIKPINNRIYYIMLNNCYYIKRLEVKDEQVIAIISDNGNKREELTEADRLEIFGRAILQQSNL